MFSPAGSGLSQEVVGSSSTAWRLLCLPVPRVAGCGPGRPRARARMLLRPLPDRAIPAGAPRCSLRCAQGHRHPGAARPSGTRGRRSELATRGTGGLDDTPAHMSEVVLQVEAPGQADGNQQRLHQARGWVAKTAQRAEADLAGACGSRAGVLRWGVAGSDRGSLRGRRTARGPTAGRPSSVARAGGSEGGSRCAARATRP